MPAGDRFAIVPVAVLADQRVSPAVGWTYAALASFAGRNRVARPGWRTLAELRGVDAGTVGRHLARLVELGYLERLQPLGRRGRGHAQEYRLVDNPINARGDARISYPQSARTATRNARDSLHAPIYRDEQREAQKLFLPGTGWIE